MRVSDEDYAACTPGPTAHWPINAILAVRAAAPGIRTAVELPQIIPLYSCGAVPWSPPSTR
ncbi:MAG: hypothetical protein P8Y58_10145 [Novosphingobium sp.]